MKRCVIITAFVCGDIRSICDITQDDFILCADGGYELAKKEGIHPHVVIGDFDSMPEQDMECDTCIHVPVEKDDTDTGLCLNYAIDHGYQDIFIVGGIGGRLDHTYANLQLLAKACDKGCHVIMADNQNQVMMLKNGTRTIPRKQGYKLSVFAYSPVCYGVSEKGVHYPLDRATLDHWMPLGVSNEFEAEEAVITVEDGCLLIILSRDAH